LDQQSILAYGNQQALVAGLQLEADVLQETRSLLEWLFEPLFSIQGRV
jgi:membrane fusion protein